MAPKRKKKRRAIQNPLKVAKKKGQLRRLDAKIKVRKKALKKTQSLAKKATKSTRSQGVKLHKVEKKRKKVSRRSTKLF